MTEHVRPDPDVSVSVNDEGFEIRRADELVVAVVWISVQTISAYLHVTRSGSLLCLVFTCDGPVRRVEVIRSNAGWGALVNYLESHFRGFMPAWESRVEQGVGPYPRDVVVWKRG